MRGDALGPLHGLPIGVKDLEDVAGLRTTYGSVLFRDHVPAQDQLIVQAARQAGAIVLGKTNTPEWGAGANTRNAVYGATGNPFDPMRSAAGSVRRLRGGAGDGNGAARHRIRHGRLAAQPGGVLRHRRLPAHAGPGAERKAAARLESALGARADGAHGARPLPAAVLHGVRRRTGPVGDHHRWTHSPSGRRFRGSATVDLARLRVALTPNFGFAPTERHIAEVFAEKTGVVRQVFAVAEDTSPDCAGTDEVFEVLRATAALASPL